MALGFSLTHSKNHTARFMILTRVHQENLITKFEGLHVNNPLTQTQEENLLAQLLGS